MAERTVPSAQKERDGRPQEGTRAQEQYVRPPVDIYETGEGLVVVADLPGVRREDLKVEVKDDILTIEARAPHQTPGEPVYREFESPCFFRQFQLSDTVDVSKISADLKHGVLSLKLPKAEAAKPRQIEVKVG